MREPRVGLIAGAAFLLAVLVGSPVLSAEDELDLDLWHSDLAAALGDEPDQPPYGRAAFGLYPTLGAVIGPPNWISYQGNLTLSVTDGRHFSLLVGYGYEGGPSAESHIFTLGWGGVRPIPSASKQLGFHSKFLRYRRWDEPDDERYNGLSVGTEHGIGYAAVSLEVGAARSDRDHWLVVFQFSLKLAGPVHIPLGKTPSG